MSVPAADHFKVGEVETTTNRSKGCSELEKVARLEQSVVLLERERSSQLYSKQHEFRKVFCSLEETELRLSQERKTEKKELKHQIFRIRSSVNNFQKMLIDMKPGVAFMEKLKQVLEEIEASILAFKEKQREIYEQLLVEERQVSHEVTAFEKKMETWTSGTSTGKATTATTGSATVMREEREGNVSALPPAVLALERFLGQTGGAQGGWDDYDHNTFLRIRRKFPGDAGFLEAAARELPTRSEAEIQAHSDWYTEYCSLLESKKKAIQQWRNSRQLAHSKQLEAANLKQETHEREGTTDKEKWEKRRQKSKEKLHAWKIQQELKKKDAENERLRAENELAKKEEKEKLKMAALRLQVQCYQQVRERERMAALQEEELRKVKERDLRRVATKDIEKFRDRVRFEDLVVAAEKRDKLKKKELEKIEQEKRLNKLKEQVKLGVTRDPSRLFKLTAGWEERRKADTEDQKIGVGWRVLPRRAVPAWRQGL